MAYNRDSGRSSRSRWWTPANEIQRKLFESAKEDVVCYLTINKEGVKARTAYSKMAVDMETNGIPFESMGFRSFGEFLFHLGDVITVRQDPYNTDYLFLRQTANEDELSHIQELVSKTPTNRSYKGFKANFKNTTFVQIDRLLNINYDLRITVNPPPSSYPKRRGGAGFRIRDNLPRPPSMASLCRKEVRPGLVRAVESALADYDDDSDSDGMEAFDSSCMSTSTTRYLPAGLDDEDEWEDMFDGKKFTTTTTTSNTKVTTSASSLPFKNNDNCNIGKENSLKDLNKFGTSLMNGENTRAQTLPKKEENTTTMTTANKEFVTPGSSKKKIYKNLKKMQMTLLPNKSFKGDLLGADEYGYLYIKPLDSTLEKFFNDFCQQIQKFYDNIENQREFRMSPNEMDEGIFVIFYLEDQGFIRGRIDHVNHDMKLCYVFAIDFCDYYTVYWNDIYHIAHQFTERHPRVVQVILRKTENYMFLNDNGIPFSTICDLTFEKFNSQEVQVQNVSPVHPLYRAPLVDIFNENQNILSALEDNGLVISTSNNSTTLTPKQCEVLQSLERKSHVVPSLQ